MAPRTATAKASGEEPQPEEPQSIWEEVTVETKAGPFTFREVDGETYDKCVELSSKMKTIGGEEREVTDMVMLLRWLAEKSATEKGVDIERINKLPFHARQKVLTAVNELYFPDSVDELVRQLRMRGYTVTPPAAETDSGNA